MADAVLTNSEVQIVVDETGGVFARDSGVKSGSDAADDSALELAGARDSSPCPGRDLPKMRTTIGAG
jgi:hypothetical protein